MCVVMIDLQHLLTHDDGESDARFDAVKFQPIAFSRFSSYVASRWTASRSCEYLVCTSLDDALSDI